MLPKIEIDIPDFDLVFKLAKEAKIICVPGSCFGKGGEGHLRFSYCFSEEHIRTGMDRIIKWWNETELNPKNKGK